MTKWKKPDILREGNNTWWEQRAKGGSLWKDKKLQNDKVEGHRSAGQSLSFVPTAESIFGREKYNRSSKREQDWKCSRISEFLSHFHEVCCCHALPERVCTSGPPLHLHQCIWDRSFNTAELPPSQQHRCLLVNSCLCNNMVIINKIQIQ